MEVLFLWAALAVLVGMFANARGRSGIGFFLLSLLLSPLLGFIIVMVIKNLDAEQQQEAQRRREEEQREFDRKREHEKQIAALSALAKPSEPVSTSSSIADEIAKLGDLLNKGLLTQGEFDQQKAALLKRG